MASEHHRVSGGRLNQEIANAVVRGRKRAFGRGPVKAQAFYRQNVIVVVMQDTLSEAERAVCAEGLEDEVLRMRSRFEQTLRGDLAQTVLQLTGCRVEAFMATHHVGPDLAVDVLVLDRDIPSETVTSSAVEADQAGLPRAEPGL